LPRKVRLCNRDHNYCQNRAGVTVKMAQSARVSIWSRAARRFQMSLLYKFCYSIGSFLCRCPVVALLGTESGA
jgi:hypothetical protein